MSIVEVFISSLFCGCLNPNILCATYLRIIEVGKLPVDDDRVWRGLIPVATALLVTTATEKKKTTLDKTVCNKLFPTWQLASVFFGLKKFHNSFLLWSSGWVYILEG